MVKRSRKLVLIKDLESEIDRAATLFGLLAEGLYSASAALIFEEHSRTPVDFFESLEQICLLPRVEIEDFDRTKDFGRFLNFETPQLFFRGSDRDAFLGGVFGNNPETRIWIMTFSTEAELESIDILMFGFFDPGNIMQPDGVKKMFVLVREGDEFVLATDSHLAILSLHFNHTASGCVAILKSILDDMIDEDVHAFRFRDTGSVVIGEFELGKKPLKIFRPKQ